MIDEMLWTLIFALLFFSLIIFVHELGHFLTARIFKVKVHEFALGMGPKIFSKRKDDTLYSLRAIPVGGFCSMEGEDSDSDDEGSFSNKAWHKRLIILAAGAGMNVILGFIICTTFVGISASVGGGLATPVVETVLEESDLSGFLQPGDRIVELGGQKINIKRDLDYAMQNGSREEMTIRVRRGGETLSATFKPMETKYSDGTPAFVMGINVRIEKPNVFGVIREGFYQTIWMGKIVFVSLGMLVGGKVSVSEISGPVGVVGAINTAAQSGGTLGFLNVLYLAAFISVNIGIMNLLPIPALDGGRIFFILVELIRRKPIPPEKEGVVHFVGLMLLLGVMVFATWNDIMRLISGI